MHTRFKRLVVGPIAVVGLSLVLLGGLGITAALKDSARALSKQIPVRPTDCRIPRPSKTAANSAEV